MEVTKCEDEDEGEDRMDGVGNTAAAGLKNVVGTASDPFNFINTVARKYESASELQLSEGPLSSRLSSVSEQSRDSSAISSHYARLSKERSGSTRKESSRKRAKQRWKATPSQLCRVWRTPYSGILQRGRGVGGGRRDQNPPPPGRGKGKTTSAMRMKPLPLWS
jgi:hypothetical protein